MHYELLDFGDGRKLERFGEIVLDRPAAVAEGLSPKHPSAWQSANARFDRRAANDGQWNADGNLPQTWIIEHGFLRFELKRTDFGHVGFFPEQSENWDWVSQEIRDAGRPLKILNLFAYTGGSTLAAAAAGAAVVHVDGAKNVVGWARRNAAASSLSEAPIRWIVEDARKFVARELKRKNHYDAVILDPPTYGHGPKGEPWHIKRHLSELLECSFDLTHGSRAFVLLTSHSPQFEVLELQSLLRGAADAADGDLDAHALVLRTAAGRELPSGYVGRWKE